MVDPQAVQDRGVQVVDMHRVLDDVVAEIVGLAVDDARLDAAAGHPDREAARMMIAAVVLARQFALAVDRAAELAAPDDQRIVQQPALLQILDQRLAGLIDVAALVRQIAGDIAMLVPAAMKDLHESHIAFGHPASQQATGGKRARLLHIRSVHIENVLRFVRDVGQFGHRSLHAKGHFVLGDAGLRFRIADFSERLADSAVPANRACGGELPRSTPGGLDRIQHRITLAAQGDALMLARQEPGAPQAVVQRLSFFAAGPGCGQHDKGGQILVQRAQAIAEPGSQTGAARQLVAGADVGNGRIVIDRFGVQRS